MNQKELMHAGELYIAADEELSAIRGKCQKLCFEYNKLQEDDSIRRKEILKELFGQVGDNCTIHSSIRCDYGKNIYIGNGFFANFDCIFLDVGDIRIGDNVMLAPRVCLYTATHPIDFEIRNEYLEYGLPITIKDNVWIGGSVVVNPGVTIGENSVIGSGSVVTKDIPANVIAAGNPCRVIRAITDEDKKYWTAKKQRHFELLEK